MIHDFKLKPPFFEIGPKAYLYGRDVLELALAAEQASIKYDVDVIFTASYFDIYPIKQKTSRIFVFAPHMDPLMPGRGLADVLPEAVKAAGAVGVMLNHSEKPLSYSVLGKTIARADDVGLATIVCADSIVEARAIAMLGPNIIAAEPTELIGSGNTSDSRYVTDSIAAIKSVNPDIYVLQGAGIKNGSDVYQVISAGAEATGSSSGIIKAADPIRMVDEMIRNVREAWDKRHEEDDYGI
jgi:triosephosphate isomerase